MAPALIPRQPRVNVERARGREHEAVHALNRGSDRTLHRPEAAPRGAIVREVLDVAAKAGVGKPEMVGLLGVGQRTLYDWIDGDEELRAHVASLPLPTEAARDFDAGSPYLTPSLTRPAARRGVRE